MHTVISRNCVLFFLLSYAKISNFNLVLNINCRDNNSCLKRAKKTIDSSLLYTVHKDGYANTPLFCYPSQQNDLTSFTDASSNSKENWETCINVSQGEGSWSSSTLFLVSIGLNESYMYWEGPRLMRAWAIQEILNPRENMIRLTLGSV